MADDGAARDWFAARERPPEPLARAIEEALAETASGGRATDAFLAGARARLLRAVEAMPLGREQRVAGHGLRPAAADLLVADALVTYAVAAAVDEDVSMDALLSRLDATGLMTELTRLGVDA